MRPTLSTVPVTVRDVDDEHLLELALVENIQREELNPIEEAQAYHRLQDEFRLTQDEIARRVGRDRTTVANTLRLLDLPDEVQDLLAQDKLTAGHARAILSVTDEDRRLKLAEKIVAEGLSVREAETLARLFAAGGAERTPRPIAPKSFKIVARKLRRLLATNVRVKQAANKCKIEIEFQGEEELERIFRLLSEGPVREGDGV